MVSSHNPFTSSHFPLTLNCRIGDNDARCGPSSLQKFDGEDLAAAERAQAQHQQCYDWWESQRAQHEAQKAAQAVATLREQEAVCFAKLLHFSCNAATYCWSHVGPAHGAGNPYTARALDHA